MQACVGSRCSRAQCWKTEQRGIASFGQGRRLPAGKLRCMAPGVREVLNRAERMKLDETDDRAFYAQQSALTADVCRLSTHCKHVDNSFLAQVTELYRQRIPPGGAVLDLCSSWVSHLPEDVKYSRVVGHGLNAAELAKNKQLDEFFVRNLNKEPTGWAFADQSFDAVVCCVSIQYLQQPELVLKEVYRVLKPGGVVIFTFSNRMFYHKAISAWRDATGYARCQLVKQYFQSVEGYTAPEALTKVEKPGGGAPGAWQLPAPLTSLIQLFERSGSDPFYAVLAYRNYRPA